MNEQIINNQKEWKPELAETFEVDFLNKPEVRDAIFKIGFSFRRSGSEEDGKVYFEGERDDGTTIEIIIEKGENYKSPAEQEQAE